MTSLLSHIASLIGEENLFTDSSSLLAYSGAASYSGAPSGAPVAVARPRHPASLARLAAFCNENKQPLLIRGNGTQPVQRPCCEGKILLVMTGLSRLYEIDTANRVVYAQAGLPAESLRSELAKQGLFCPLGGFGTLGGALAVNRVSGLALEYGNIANFVDSLEICLATGQRVNVGAQDRGLKSPSLPIAPLFCGSQGKLGVISACRLRLLPAPESGLNLFLPFGEMEDAAQAASQLMASRIHLHGLEILDEICARMLGWKNAGLFARFSGSAADTQAFERAIRGLFPKAVPATSPTAMAALLPKLYAARGPFCLLHIGCAPARLGRLVSSIYELAKEQNLQIAMFGDGAVAVLAIAVFGDATACEKLAKKLFPIELMLNDLLESQEEAGLGREIWQKKHQASFDAAMKNLFDPNGIFNPAP